MIRTTQISGILFTLIALASCSMGHPSLDIESTTSAAIRSSFRSEGIVSTASLATDETNRACSAAAVLGKPLDNETESALEAINMKAIQYPVDGRYLGDWREGEKIAQNGAGKTWSDEAGKPNGGNCYNCHQITKTEISFGTLGPSLYRYGKLRGVTNPDSQDSLPIVRYTWGKIWNAKSNNACSLMPRFGHMGILTEGQVRDVMALLLDPKSPVNQE